MSAYRDYVSDFPRRCSVLLERLRLPARGIGLGVTHLLSITTVGLIVPHERLRRLNDESQTEHPSGDRRRYKEAASQYDRLLEEYFLSSPLSPDGPQLLSSGASTWRKGKIKSVKPHAPNFDQVFATAKPVEDDVKVGTMIGIMRNALAHGNIVTGGREIHDIMFLSRDEYPAFRFVAVEPEDLRTFMTNYFEFLRHLDLGRGRLVDDAPEAA